MNNIALDPVIIGLILLALANVILLIIIFRMNSKMNKFLIHINADNIKDSLDLVKKDLDDLDKFKTELQLYLKTVESRIKRSVQSVNTLRFNPFKGTGAGGNQSFATTMLDEQGNGVIISTLYSREHVSIFAKPVIKFTTEHELSEEEKQSLKEAQEKL